MRKQLVVITALMLTVLVPMISSAKTESLHVERSFPVSQGDRVVVDVSFHKTKVEIRPGDTVEIVVDIEVSASASKAKRLIEQYQPVFSDQGSEIRVRSSAGRQGWSLTSARKSGTVRVLMPPDVSLEVDSSSGSTKITGDLGTGAVVVDASSGRVELDGAAESLHIDVSSGSVDVMLQRPASKAEIDASSGSISLDGPVHEVSIGTSSGGIRAHGLLGSATLDASSGTIKASWSSIPPRAKVSANTSSGGVSLSFPEGTSLSGVVDTSSGGISSDFPGDRSDRGHHLVLEGGPDAVRINVDTSSGGVRLSSHG